VIVLHDMTLDRTTNGHGYAGDQTWADLQRLDAGMKKSPNFAATRIPTLRETVAWAKQNDMGLEVELKDDDRPDVLARRVLEILEETDGFGHVFIISFNHKELARLKERDERVRTEAITHACHADLVHVLRSCGAESVSIELKMFDPDDARALHDAGLCNRVHLPRPSYLSTYWTHGRDVVPEVVGWVRDGLIDSLSSDDVTFVRKIVDRAAAVPR
jgi:glycerophosphoryl diester phosphodiesterase